MRFTTRTKSVLYLVVRFLNFPRYLHEWDGRDEVFKNGSSKICGRQPLKNLK